MAQQVRKRGKARDESAFHADARAILAELRDRLSSVLELAVAGIEPGATEWARALSIDTKLAWKLTHLLDASADLESLQFVPGRQAFDQILVAAERVGAPREASDAARLTFERYETLVRTHAGSRKAFDVLVASQHPRGTSRAEVNLRRSAVEANASLLGVRASAQVAIYGFAPGADGESIDVLGVRKIEGMERVRPNVNWRIARSFRTAEDGSPLPGGPAQLSSARTPKALVGLAAVPDFSTQPLPTLVRVETEPGVVEFELRGGEVGASARFDLTTAEIFRPGDHRHEDENGDRRTRVMAGIRVPCDLLHVDLIVHRALFESTRPRVDVISTLHTGLGLEFRDADRLPIEPEFVSLGTGLAKIDDRERERHAELVRWALHEAGWDGSEFDVHRLKLAYPPLPSAVALDWTRRKRKR
ncbi:MAG: hypothetical protein AAGB93_00415 [Planctomycetota bacterium]